MIIPTALTTNQQQQQQQINKNKSTTTTQTHVTIGGIEPLTFQSTIQVR